MGNDFIVLDQSYEYFEQLKDDAMVWDLDFRQTGAGESGHRLVQIASPCFGLVYTIFRSPYDQRSVAPKGLRTFSILADERMPSTWCGHDFTANTLVAMPLTDEFRALSAGYFSNYVFSLPEEILDATASGQFHRDWPALQPNPKGAALTISDQDIGALRSLLKKLAEAAKFFPEYITLDLISAELAALIIRGLINAAHVTPRRIVVNRQKYFRSAQSFIDSNIQNPISIKDICKATGVAERTLEYAFKEQFHISPKAYLNCQRLAKVRQELMTSDGRQTSISEIAGLWGFWQMGQFARDYRKIYGENPSVTLARSRQHNFTGSDE